ncbi:MULTISPECIES: winged helix DNA-binding protein [unclassified Streptomyces]|uniref:winged helix DNA-binding protein n=1 Tax=unclassified Streptomyces TaxID=2593676 RepID=UPI0008998629|nr:MULTISPECIES: winged helix DNA-binding protein [unclassified Streptomyces]SED63712.1 Winged helix DNA-binding domain-containing protein [Streptomyces sp. PAN_FS17]SEE84150.1 Winged helix DNA-binding domain-containing protein [Streptomyces sp. KS_5]
MTTTTPLADPLVDPRVIALAHYAGRALLENVLARHGSTFQQSVTLRLVAVAEGPVERDTLVGGVVGALKTDATEARSVVDELIAAGLLAAEEPSAVRITDAGRERWASTSAATAPITARIYDGIPKEDLAVAGRVLTLITERANAEFAAMAATAAK